MSFILLQKEIERRKDWNHILNYGRYCVLFVVFTSLESYLSGVYWWEANSRSVSLRWFKRFSLMDAWIFGKTMNCYLRRLLLERLPFESLFSYWLWVWLACCKSELLLRDGLEILRGRTNRENGWEVEEDYWYFSSDGSFSLFFNSPAIFNWLSILRWIQQVCLYL